MKRNSHPSDSNPPNEPLFVNAPGEEEQEFDPREQIEVFWRRRWTIVAIVVLTTCLGILYAITRRPIYTAVTKLAIAIDSAKSAPTSALALIPGLDGMVNTRNVATQVEIMKSPDLLDKAYAKLSDKEKKQGFGSPTLPIGTSTIESNDDSDVVSITVRSHSPKTAAKLANLIAETYLEEDLEDNNRATAQAREFVEGEVKRADQDLEIASLRLAQYKEQTNMVAPDQQVSNTANQIFTLRSSVDTLRGQLTADNAMVRQLESQLRKLSPEVAYSQTVQQNPEFSLTQGEISKIQTSLTEAQQEFTPDSPEVTALKNQLATQQARLKSITKNLVASSTSQRNPLIDKAMADYATALGERVKHNAELTATQNALPKLEAQLAKFPTQQRSLADLQLRVDTLLTNYKALQTQYTQLKIQEHSNLPFGKIAAQARPPLTPSYPVKSQMVLGSLFLGLLLGLMVAKLLEKLDTRVHDPMTVDNITGRPVLTVVPEVHPDKLSPKQQVLIGMVDNNHGFLESFRLLRNNIMFSAPDQQLRALSVTSAGKGEGKSTTSVNLAIAMAMDGKRVLLIDGDLRRPTVHNYLDIPRDIGFTNVVKGLSTLEEAVVKTEYENVYVLPAGPLPPNPTEFLNSLQARRVIEDAKEQYDLVVMDSPPCTGLSDVQVISTLVDGVVLVVALETTQKQYLMATMRLLRQADAPVLGTVINRVQHKRHAYGYYSYYYGYGYTYAYAYSYQQDDENDTKKKRKRKTRRRTDK